MSSWLFRDEGGGGLVQDFLTQRVADQVERKGGKWKPSGGTATVAALAGIDDGRITAAVKEGGDIKHTDSLANWSADAGYSLSQLEAQNGGPIKNRMQAVSAGKALDRGIVQEDLGKANENVISQIAETNKPQIAATQAQTGIAQQSLTEERAARIASNDFLNRQLLQQSIDSARDSKTSLQLAQMNNAARLRAHEMDMEMYDRDSTREAYSGIGLGLAGLAAMLAA